MKFIFYFCIRNQNKTKCKYKQKINMGKKMIIISTTLRRQMFKKFGVVPRTLKDAMVFRTSTALAKVLQDYALENGGEIWVPMSQQEGGQHEC